MAVKAFPVLVSALSLAACASPSSRISTALQLYGLGPDKADCVGNRLEGALSISQLRQLGRAARQIPAGTTAGTLTAADLARAASTIDDPKVPLEVARATLACSSTAS